MLPLFWNRREPARSGLRADNVGSKQGGTNKDTLASAAAPPVAAPSRPARWGAAQDLLLSRSSMRRCHRPRHRHSLPSARQSPPPAPAPGPAPAAVFHADCASAPPTPAALVVASARGSRRRWSACGSARRTAPAPTSPRAPSGIPTIRRPLVAAPRAPSKLALAILGLRIGARMGSNVSGWPASGAVD
jgi:hypothetical protein